MNYTKGKWEIIEPTNKGITSRIITNQNGSVVATVNHFENAHLIASAPEMYEALRVLKIEDGFIKGMDLVRQVLAKVEGK